MSHHIKVEPMPDNPAARTINHGDDDGLWRIVVKDLGAGSIIPEKSALEIMAENLIFEEAINIASEIGKRLNGH